MAIEETLHHPMMVQVMPYHRMKEELERDYFGQWP